MSDPRDVLVVGAGVAGMTCARTLAEAGHTVTVLDKGNRPGGRLTTRRSRRGPEFDQGAQYLTARSVTFQQQVQRWIDAGILAPWTGRFVDLTPGRPPIDTQRQAKRYVGMPTMAALAEQLSRPAPGIDGPHFDHRVEELSRDDAGWFVRVQAPQDAANPTPPRLGPFRRVVLSLPPPQARDLLQTVGTSGRDLAERLGEVQIAPTWTLMLAFAQPLEVDPTFAGAFVDHHPLASIVHNSAKPGRPAVTDAGDCWVAHASQTWSTQHLEDQPAQVAAILTAAFGQLLDRPLPEPTYAAVHRWRFGHVIGPLADRWLLSDDRTLAYCGDACTQGSPANIERAWLSGLGLAEHLRGSAP